MGDTINMFRTDIKMNIDTRTVIENEHSTCNTPTNYRNEYMKMSQRSKIQVAFHSSFLTQGLQFFMGRDRDSLPIFHDNTHPSGISNLKTSITMIADVLFLPPHLENMRENQIADDETPINTPKFEGKRDRNF